MAENMIKFLRGNVASLPQTATPGAVYFTKDEGLYLGLADGTYHRYGDFIEVANVDSLPAEGAHIKAMYYCTAENILAKWNGTKWVQINKQQTLAELGGVAKSVYEAKIAALEKADTDNATAIANLTTYVGTIPEGSTATNVVAYVQEKTSGIASEGAMTELSNRVTQAEKDIDAIEADYLKAADKTELTGKITAAQTAIDNEKTRAEGIEGGLRTDVDAIKADYLKAADKTALQDNIDAVAGDVTTIKGDYLKSSDKTALESKMATDIANAVKDEADLRVAADDAIKASIGTVAEGKTVVKMIEEAQAAATYDDTALAGRVTTVEGKVENIEKDYLKASDKNELQGNINTVAGDVATIKGDYLKSSDKTELEGKINAKVAQADYDTKVAALEAEDERIAGLVATEKSRAEGVEAGLEDRLVEVEAFFKLAEGEQLDTALDTLKEIQTYITSEGAAADQMVLDIAANKKAIEDHVATNHDFASADAALKDELNGEIAKKADKTTVEGIDGRLTTAEGKVSTLEGKMTAVEGAVATKAEKTYVDDELAKLVTADTGLGNRITDLETASATHALKTDVQAVETALNEYETAHASDYTNAQIDAAIDADVKVVADDLKAYKEAHASDYTNTAIDSAISTAIANAGHASAADLTTHTGNADIHVTTEDKAKWNAAEQNAKDYADAQVEAAKTDASNKDAVVLSEAQKAVAAAKTELQGNIDTVSGALETYKTSNDAEVAKKANSADVYTKTEVEAMLTWGEF